jgi:hypothetical protein
MESLLTGGGIAALLTAIAYVGKMILDWRKAPKVQSLAVVDAQTANAILSGTLRELRDENKRLVGRVGELEEALDIRDKKIGELERRLNRIADELSALKQLGH